MGRTRGQPHDLCWVDVVVNVYIWKTPTIGQMIFLGWVGFPDIFLSTKKQSITLGPQGSWCAALEARKRFSGKSNQGIALGMVCWSWMKHFIKIYPTSPWNEGSVLYPDIYGYLGYPWSLIFRYRTSGLRRETAYAGYHLGNQLGSMSISGTDWLELPTIYKAYFNLFFRPKVQGISPQFIWPKIWYVYVPPVDWIREESNPSVKPSI